MKKDNTKFTHFVLAMQFRTVKNYCGSASFTLIELLITIAIIAILAAILLPSISGSLKMAQGIKCTSNFKQLGMGAIMYSDASASYLPVSESRTHASREAFWKYLTCTMVAPTRMSTGYPELGQGIFRCPTWILDKKIGNMYSWGGYGWNWRFVGYRDDLSATPRLYFQKTTQLSRPSEIILSGDTTNDPSLGNNNTSFFYLQPPNIAGISTLGTQHRGSINVLFADGHSSWMPRQTLLRNDGILDYYYKKVKTSSDGY